MIAVIIGCLTVAAILAGPLMSDVETPSYEVIQSQGNIEVRQYQPMVVARVDTEGMRDDAIGDGFRLLADYIFGNNIIKQDIAMTAPVQQQQSSRIAMTAPVQQQASGDSWEVSFVMPAQYNMETLPAPVNERIILTEIPAKKFVAIQFSGSATDENLQQHETLLTDYISANNLSVIDKPKYAFYNPPWTLPILRRNEIMFEIRS